MEDDLEKIQKLRQKKPQSQKKKEADNSMEIVSSLYSTGFDCFRNFYCNAQLFGTATSI